MPADEVWISTQGDDEQFYKMLPIEEFMARLDQNKRPFIRYTNEAAEKARFDELMEDIHIREEKMKTQFLKRYSQIGAMRRTQYDGSVPYHRQ